MKPELTWAYLQSIQPEPLPRFVAMSEAGWVEAWKSQSATARNYDEWPSSWAIPENVWAARLEAQWARLAEYDRLTAERNRQAKEIA